MYAKLSRGLLLLLSVVCASLLAGEASAQIPQPTNPVTICGTQAAPPAVSYQLIFDGGAPVAQTLTAPAAATCPAGSTHSFTVPAARFTLGAHTVQLRGTNTVGSTLGPVYSIAVGVAPGAFTVNAVVPE